LFEFSPVTGLDASLPDCILQTGFGLVPTKSEFKKCDSIFFEKSESSGVPVIPKQSGPAVEAKALKLKRD